MTIPAPPLPGCIEAFCHEPAVVIDPEDGRERCARHAIATSWAWEQQYAAANPEGVTWPWAPDERGIR